MGAWAPISDSNDIFIDEEAGFAAVNAAPLKALKNNTRRVQVQESTSGQKKRGQNMTMGKTVIYI